MANQLGRYVRTLPPLTPRHATMTIHFAPMQGYVDGAYRRLHYAIYGGVDCYYTPFMRIEKREPRRQDFQRLKDSKGDGTSLVPQIIFGSEDEFLALTNAVRSWGFNRIDLNLGCPYPMHSWITYET